MFQLLDFEINFLVMYYFIFYFEGTIFLDGKWWEENELRGRCFIMGRWWESLQEWLDETSQKLGKQIVFHHIYLLLTSLFLSTLEYAGPSSQPVVEVEGEDEVLEGKEVIFLDKGEEPAAKIQRVDGDVDVGGAGDNDFFIKRGLFWWQAKPHPRIPRTWKPPSQGLGLLFYCIRDEIRSKGWKGEEEHMKSSAEYQDWLRTVKGKSYYRHNLRNADLKFNGKPVYIFREGDKLFYANGTLKQQGKSPTVGSKETNFTRDDYEVNPSKWKVVCCDLTCWKQGKSKAHCEEHVEHSDRGQELFVVRDMLNEDMTVILVFNPQVQSCDFDHHHLNQRIHSSDGESNKSLQAYFKHRGVPPIVTLPKRNQDYKSHNYSKQKIQRLKETYWKERFARVEFEVLEKW
ncbi:uncharacterized protein LOC118435105 isoform X1 [Folsomia candida]|uniref:uncharacterized protein LOC118435105 isoform X1 n=1 Tax=Folsomia candida TaxID=158441 RepID=UPI001604AA35|nr:uncharacterized protein LOC118435105 isoform X1 [Folsomia candida]